MQSRAIVRLARTSVFLACAALQPSMLPGQTQPPVTAAAATNAAPAPAVRFPQPFQPLKADYDKEKAVICASRTMKLRAIVEEQLKSVQEAAKEKEKTGNVRGMAVGRQAQSMMNTALAELEQRGEFTPPDSVRAELAEMRATLLATLTEAAAQYSNGLQRLNAKYAPDFNALAKNQGLLAADAPPEAQTALFQRWTEWSASNAPPVAATTVTAAPPGATNAAPAGGEWAQSTPGSGVPAGAATTAESFEESAASAAWKPVGRWTGRMTAMEMLDIALAGATANLSDSIESPITGNTSTWTYEVIEAIPAGSRGPFRLVSIPGQHRVHVQEWPGRSNQGHLVFRTPSVNTPTTVGFELQAASLTAVPTPAAGGNTDSAKTSKMPLVQVRLVSQPAGATVALDGLAVNTAAGTPAQTPCMLRMTAGLHAIKFALDNYRGQLIGDFRAYEGAALEVKLAPIVTAPGRIVTVNAQSEGWQTSGVMVKADDELWLFPAGAWNIGAGNEACGPEGYPQSGKTAAYYKAATDPRQQSSAAYGALLLQIGPIANAIAITNSIKIAVTSDGMLFFDVNEQPTPTFRANNKGAVKVKIVVLRDGLPVSMSAPPAKTRPIPTPAPVEPVPPANPRHAPGKPKAAAK